MPVGGLTLQQGVCQCRPTDVTSFIKCVYENSVTISFCILGNNLVCAVITKK